MLASKAATKTLQHNQTLVKHNKRPAMLEHLHNQNTGEAQTKHQRCRRQKAATKTHHRRLEAQCKTKTADREHCSFASCLCMTWQCSNTSSASSSMLNMCEYKVQCSSIRDFKIFQQLKCWAAWHLKYCVQHSVQHTTDHQYGVKMNTPMQCWTGERAGVLLSCVEHICRVLAPKADKTTWVENISTFAPWQTISQQPQPS